MNRRMLFKRTVGALLAPLLPAMAVARKRPSVGCFDIEPGGHGLYKGIPVITVRVGGLVLDSDSGEVVRGIEIRPKDSETDIGAGTYKRPDGSTVAYYLFIPFDSRYKPLKSYTPVAEDAYKRLKSASV